MTFILEKSVIGQVKMGVTFMSSDHMNHVLHLSVFGKLVGLFQMTLNQVQLVLSWLKGI